MFVFDLDQTVINSDHRTRFVDGKLDLAHWRANCTAKQIAKDKLLPLANYWKQLKAEGNTIAVITARVMSPADYTFLHDHELKYNFMFSRKGENNEATSLHKWKAFHMLKKHSGINFPFMCYFEDHDGCLAMARKLGVITFDAKVQNSLAKTA